VKLRPLTLLSRLGALVRDSALAILIVGIVLPSYGVLDPEHETLQIEVTTDPAIETVLSPRDIIVKIQSKIGGIEMRDVTLLSTGLLSEARPDISKCVATVNQSGSLGARETREYRFHLDRISGKEAIQKPSLLRFPAGTRVVNVRAHFDAPEEGEKFQDKPFDLDFAADKFGIALGGAVGGFVAALLVLVVGWRDSNSSIGAKRAIREIALNVVVGGLSAWILSYIGELSKQFDAGVTVSATSFQGGLVVGFFSYKLGQFLIKGITASSKKKPQSQDVSRSEKKD